MVNIVSKQFYLCFEKAISYAEQGENSNVGKNNDSMSLFFFDEFLVRLIVIHDK